MLLWFVLGIIGTCIGLGTIYLEAEELNITPKVVVFCLLGIILGLATLVLMTTYGVCCFFEKFGDKTLYKIKKDD